MTLNLSCPILNFWIQKNIETTTIFLKLYCTSKRKGTICLSYSSATISLCEVLANMFLRYFTLLGFGKFAAPNLDLQIICTLGCFFYTIQINWVSKYFFSSVFLPFPHPFKAVHGEINNPTSALSLSAASVAGVRRRMWQPVCYLHQLNTPRDLRRILRSCFLTMPTL